MAKTIKFNLICDGYPVRTLDDLREHFSIEDVMAHYKSGMLARWLEVRGYERELAKVNSISNEDEVGISKTLVEVFEVEMDNTKIEEIGYLLHYEAKRKEVQKQYAEQHVERMGQLKASLDCYQNLKKQMAEHKDNFAALKADVAELHSEYLTAFKLDYRSLFYYLKGNAPAAIYMMLAYDEFRDKYLPSGTVSVSSGDMTEMVDDTVLSMEVYNLFRKTNTDTVNCYNFIEAVKGKEEKMLLARRLARYHNTSGSRKKVLSIDHALEAVTAFLDRVFLVKNDSTDADTAEVFRALCDMATDKNIKNIFEGKYDRFRVIKRNTSGNWDDMIDREEKCIVLWMAEGCEVRPNGCRDVCHNSGDTKNKFLLLDGVDYRSQKASSEVLILEV